MEEKAEKSLGGWVFLDATSSNNSSDDKHIRSILTKVKNKKGDDVYLSLTGTKRKIVSNKKTGLYRKSDIKKALDTVMERRSIK